SNRRPPACKAGALPTELWPRSAERMPAGESKRRLACRAVARAPHSPAFALWASARHPSPRLRERRMVGLGRLELPTSRLSRARSNQLSYKPKIGPHLQTIEVEPRPGERPTWRASVDDLRWKIPGTIAPRTWRGLVQKKRETETAASRQWTS